MPDQQRMLPAEKLRYFLTDDLLKAQFKREQQFKLDLCPICDRHVRAAHDDSQAQLCVEAILAKVARGWHWPPELF